MAVEHHHLLHEFPALKDKIHQLKVSDPHFRKLYDQYHDLTQTIEKMENEVTPASTIEEEKAKLTRLHLKDTLFKMLNQSSDH